MSHAISLQRPQIPHQNALQLEQDQRVGHTAWFSIASKTTVIALGVIASIFSFVFLPVTSALLATGLIAILAMGGLSCFSNNNSIPSHAHHDHSYAPATPWYKRIFTPYHHHYAPFSATAHRGNVPIGGGVPPRAPAPRSNVPVTPPAGGGRGIFGAPGGGRGIFGGLGGGVLGLGRGHNPPAGPGAPGTVGLGRGHNPPAGPGGPGHVGLGRGHNPPTGPGGPGHVGLGRGH